MSTARLEVLEADITTLRLDAIVNAANEALAGGGGVDGAIHRAAGPELSTACKAFPMVRPHVRCPTGEARITPGFRLTARHVIHTVGPVYGRPEKSAPLLRAAYRSSLALANAHALRSVAFPAISCGVYGYPDADAAAIALAACAAHAGCLTEIRFVLFGAEMYRVWVEAAAPYRRK